MFEEFNRCAKKCSNFCNYQYAQTISTKTGLKSEFSVPGLQIPILGLNPPEENCRNPWIDITNDKYKYASCNSKTLMLENCARIVRRVTVQAKHEDGEYGD